MSSAFSLKDIHDLVRVLGVEKGGSMDISSAVNFKKVMEDIKYYDVMLAPKPGPLKETCTGFNCVCWKSNIKGCVPYDTCIKCYKKLEKCKC
jgi:hypothetical protein